MGEADVRELWKLIPGHVGWEASTLGRIRSIPRHVVKNVRGRAVAQFVKGRTLKPTISASRYPMVGLTGNIKVCVHSVILRTFVGPAPNGMVTRHKDGDERNNKLSNLEYGTRRQNWEDSIRHGTARRGEKNHNALLTERAALEIRSSGDSYAALAKKYKVSKATILNVRCRRTWAWLDANN